MLGGEQGAPQRGVPAAPTVNAAEGSSTKKGAQPRADSRADNGPPRPDLVLPKSAEFSLGASHVGGTGRALLVVVDRHATKEWDLKEADRLVEQLTDGFQRGLGISGDRLQVLRGERATRNAFVRSLRQVGEEVEGKDNLLVVYFYGHGCVQEGNLNLFTADTELEGQVFTNTIKHTDLGSMYARCRATVRERGGDLQVVSVIDACRVRSLAPPGPARYVPIEDVAELFSAKHGQFAGEGVFVEPFCAALTDLARRDRTVLGDVFEAVRRNVKSRAADQEPELANGRRDLVLRDVARLRLGFEVWDQVGTGRRVEGAVVTFDDQRLTSLFVEGLRPGVHRVRVEHPAYLRRDIRIDVPADRTGQTLRVPVLPALVLVRGRTSPGARVRLGSARPDDTVDGYHLLDTNADATGWFLLRLPSLAPDTEILLESGRAVSVPVKPTGEEIAGEARVPCHDLGSLQ